MNYKNSITPQYHFDPIPGEVDEKAMMFGTFAIFLGDLMLWVYGKEQSRPEYRNARMLAVHVVLGRLTVEEAAEKAKVTRQCIHKHKREFLALFKIEKRFHDPVKEKERD